MLSQDHDYASKNMLHYFQWNFLKSYKFFNCSAWLMFSSINKEFITCEKSKPLGVYERFKFQFSQNIEERRSAMAMLW